MHVKSAIMLRVFLNNFHQSSFEPLLKYLPLENQQAVRSQQILAQDISIALKPARDLLTRIHYSWLAAPLQQFSGQMQKFILSSLPETIFSKLNRLLPLPVTESLDLASPFRSVFQDLLYKELKCDDILPIPYFPPSKLNFLTEWDKQKIVQLVDYLGLYDLANFVRQVIDKKKLKLIYDCLDIEKKQFMRSCFHSKDKIVLPLLELEPWQGDRKKLYEVIHRRGLLRLGKALSNESSDLSWVISRILDKGRGTILLNHTKQKATPVISGVLIQQIENSINYIKTKSASE